MARSVTHSATDGRQFSWRPGPVTIGCLVFAFFFAALPFTPPFWSGIGVDTKDFYAAASLSGRGENPYDLRQIVPEQDRLFNAPRKLAPSDPLYYHHSPYGYPPIFTAILRPGLAVSQPVFYLIGLAVLAPAGMAGLWLILAALRWRGRALPLLFLLGSTAMALGLYSGNPSAILLLGAGLGTWLMVRGRLFLGGAALSILLLKLPVGLPVAIALMATIPVVRAPVTSRWWRSHSITAGGFFLATAIVVLTYVAFAGTVAIRHWWSVLTTYESTLGPTASASRFAQQNLTGLPALLLDRFPTAVAVLLVTPAVLFAVAWALAPWWRNLAGLWVSWLPAALAVTAALSLSPYLHMNDLLLAAIPLLVVASQPLNIVSRIALVTWAVGAPVQLVIRTLLPVPFHTPAVAGTVGFGVVLTALLLASVAHSVRQAGVAAI